MIRVGGMGYSCTPENSIGSRISDMVLTRTGEQIDPAKTYVTGGWASVNENTEGPPIYELMETHIAKRGTIEIKPSTRVKVTGT